MKSALTALNVTFKLLKGHLLIDFTRRKSIMKFIKVLMLMSSILLCSALYATAETYESRYTPLSTSKCITLHQEHESIRQECPGFASYQLHVIESDLRQSITLIKQGKEYPLQFWSTVSPQFSTLGTKAEWRFIVNNKILSPIALISRLNVVTGEEADETTSWLVVSKITAEQVCVVAKVRPQRDGSQNQKARDIADKSGELPCLK